MPKLRRIRRNQNLQSGMIGNDRSTERPEGNSLLSQDVSEATRSDSQCPSCLGTESSVVAIWGTVEHRKCEQCRIEYLVNLEERMTPKSGRIWQI